MASYNKLPSRLWKLSGNINRQGIPLWYSVPRNQHEEIDDQTTAQPVLDDLMIFERVSDEDTRRS